MNDALIVALHEYCFLSRGLAQELRVPRLVIGPRRWNTHNLFHPITQDITGKTIVVVWTYAITDASEFHIQFFRMLSIIQHLALKRAGAIIGVCPYIVYGRQKEAGDMAQVSMHLLAAAGMHRLITVHAPSVHTVKAMRITSIPFHIPWQTLVSQLLTAPGMQRGGVGWVIVTATPHLTAHVQAIACAVGISYEILSIKRFADDSVVVTGAREALAGKRVFIFADVIYSGRSMISIANFALRCGAAQIFAGATHGIFAGQAYTCLLRSDITKIFVSNLLNDDRRVEMNSVFSIAMDDAFIKQAAIAVRKSERLREVFNNVETPVITQGITIEQKSA